ncbi:MAG: carboxypeptidase-like regulatory domain-containing protein [Bacteroidota bacterium]|nr:carboxypeptidase-like regulatory domain-containing protein [Bacteroidota bacterium]
MMEKLLHRLLLGWLLLAPLALRAQTVLRGRVLDAETHQPIPNAQVGVAGNRIGTSTNDDGRFALNIPPAYAQERLTVALLGYRSYEQTLPLPGPELLIQLKISPATLGEVQVSGSVLGLVREAVARIPRNYPVRPTRLTGFYRESDNELETERYRYLGEAVLTVFKTSYTKPKDDGEIVIEQSRLVDLQTKGLLKEGWYAGPFIPQRFDFVHNRLAFINEADFKNYDYRLAELTTYNDRPVYVITFAPKAGNTRADFEGRMYIDQQSYAFLAAEWHRTPAGIRHEVLLLSNFDAEERAYRVDYQQVAGRWYLKNVWYNTRGKASLSKSRIRHLSEFLTTAIDTAQAAAPRYAEQAQFKDVFRDNAMPYDSAFWQNYTTLLPPEQLRQALRDQNRQQQAEQLFAPLAAGAAPAAPAPGTSSLGKLMAVLGRLHYNLMGGLLPMQASAADMQLDFAPVGSAFRAQAPQHTPAAAWALYTGSGLAFDLTKNLQVYYAVRRVRGSFQGNGVEFGATYEHNFNPGHRAIRGRVGGSYFRQRLGYDFGTFDNPDQGLQVDGTKLSADRLRVAVQEFTDGWQPRLGLGVEATHHLEIVADLGLLLPWHRRSELHLAEESGFFLFRSETDVSLPAAGATVRVNNAPATVPWTLGRPLLTVGITYRLR